MSASRINCSSGGPTGRNKKTNSPSMECWTLSARLLCPDPVELRVFAVARQPVDAETARLPAPQRGVMAARREQALMGAFLDDAAAIEHDQPVHPADRRQARRRRDHPAPFHPAGELLPDRRLDLPIAP